MDLKKIPEEFAIIGLVAGGRVSDAKPIASLKPACFAHKQARKALEALQALIADDGRASMWTLEQRLVRAHGQAEADSIMEKVREAAGSTAFQGWQLGRLVSAVQEAAQRRKMVGIGEALSRAAADEQRNLSEVFESAQCALRACAQSGGRVSSMTDAIIEAYVAAFEQQPPIATGIGELDAILCGGLHNGELTILGARPAVGKSAVLLEIARTAARQQKRVLFVSLEMSERQIGNRILAANSGINGGLLRSGKKLDDKTGDALALGLEASETDGTKNLSLMVANTLTIEELAQEAQAQADTNGLDLLVVDYVQLLRTQQKTASDFERLGVVSRGLKAITLALNIPVVTAAQVRRQNNNGGVARAPGLDELRGSGDLEQDADNVLLLHKPENENDSVLQLPAYTARHNGLYEGAQMQKKSVLTIEVAKQRQGQTGRAWVVFDSMHMQFTDPVVRDPD